LFAVTNNESVRIPELENIPSNQKRNEFLSSCYSISLP